jgi:hypothetical protein
MVHYIDLCTTPEKFEKRFYHYSQPQQTLSIPCANVASYIYYLFFRVVHPATDVLFLRFNATSSSYYLVAFSLKHDV